MIAEILLASACGLFAQEPGKPPATPVPLALDTPGVAIPKEKPEPGSETLDTPGVGAGGDVSGLASPVPAGGVRRSLPPGVKIQVQLEQTVSSGTQKNGDTVRAMLAAPLRTSSGIVLAKGTPVQATVVSAAKAGTMNSGGVLTLQLTRVGTLGIVSDVQEFDGREGHKDVADSAPAKGEEAAVASGTSLTFELLENGVATGMAPAADSAAASSLGEGRPDAKGAPPVQSAPNTSPGVNQHPTNGATQGVVPRPPQE